MLPVTIRRVLLAEHRVDFRKGFNGLLGEAYALGAQPYEGDCVVFTKKDRTQLRALIGDGYGLISRRFEGGRCAPCSSSPIGPRAGRCRRGSCRCCSRVELHGAYAREELAHRGSIAKDATAPHLVLDPRSGL
ncbi:MAG: IS66 family insertion sequence element accessory protein TnpB [Deltaproteobacteria bacterium]|nr:IS66 family insertion sequence element accessory protein TnpB [Deltaproteobacteria bacterium]